MLAEPAPTAIERGWAASVVTLGELQAGVLLARDPATRAERLRRLTLVASVAPALDIDGPVAARYAQLRAASGRDPANDVWIAATALAHGLTLVTRDEAQARLPLVSTHLVT